MGYLLALSQMNYFDSINWLIELARLKKPANNNLSKGLVFDEADLTALSYISKQPVDVLEQMRYPIMPKGMISFDGQEVPFQAISPMKAKVCPQCLSEKDYHRKIWDFAMISCCPYHGRQLIDRCPACGRSIDWHRKGVSVCTCEADFRNFTVDEASEEGIYISSLFLQNMGYNTVPLSLSTPLERLNLCELFEVVIFFSRFAGNPYINNDEHMSIKNCHENTENVVSIFKDWPDNFITFLQETKFKPAKNAKFGLYKKFGNFYAGLDRMIKERPSLAFLRTAFEEYQLKIYDGGYLRQRKIGLDFNQKEHLSKTDAAQLLKTSERWIDRLCDAGKIQAIKVLSGKRHLILIKKSSVHELLELYHDLFSLEQVRKMLRIKNETVINLVRRNLLSCTRGPDIDGYPHWQFSKKDLELLFSKIEGQHESSRSYNDESDRITFSEARHKLSAYQIGTVEFFKLVSSGAIKPINRKDTFNIDSFIFSAKAVSNYISKMLKFQSEGYTMEQFKDLVGISIDAAYDLEKMGMIRTYYSGYPKLGKLISKDEAEQFHRTYITSTEIAKQCAVSPNTVIKILTRACIKPVSGPTIDGGPRYLYLRTNLSNFKCTMITPSRRAKDKVGRQASLFINTAFMNVKISEKTC